MGCGKQQVQMEMEENEQQIADQLNISQNSVQITEKIDQIESQLHNCDLKKSKSNMQLSREDLSKYKFPQIQNFDETTEEIVVHRLDEETINQLQSYFEQYIEIIDLDIYQQILERSNVVLDLETREQIFHFLDDDGDSRLTLKELIHAFYIAFNVQNRPYDSAFIYFLYLDQNQQGTISFEQLQWCFKDLNIKKQQRDILKLFNDLKNNENRISCLNFVKNFGAFSV